MTIPSVIIVLLLAIGSVLNDKVYRFSVVLALLMIAFGVKW